MIPKAALAQPVAITKLAPAEYIPPYPESMKKDTPNDQRARALRLMEMGYYLQHEYGLAIRELMEYTGIDENKIRSIKTRVFFNQEKQRRGFQHIQDGRAILNWLSHSE